MSVNGDLDFDEANGGGRCPGPVATEAGISGAR